MSHVSTYKIQIQNVNPAILGAAVRAAAADVGLEMLTGGESSFRLTTGESWGDVYVQAVQGQGINVSFDDTHYNVRAGACRSFQQRVIQHYQMHVITGALSQAGWRTNSVQGPIGQPFRIQMLS